MSAPSSNDASLFQNSVYIGINIENILYGIELLLYFKAIYILLTNRGARRKSDIFYALFSSTMMFLTTVWIATQAAFGENMWLLHSDYPGGPNAYWNENVSIWYMDWGTTAIVILQLMTDGLLIYRCRIVWNSYRVIIVPVILWFTTLVLGILVDWISSAPGGNFFTGIAAQLGLAYYTISVFMNTTLTCMICYRMVQHARKVKEFLGNEYASLYFATATVIIESVFPYTLTGIAFLVSMGVGSQTSVAFFCIYAQMMCISPQMLILRVIVGRAWDKDTFKPKGSTLKFNPGTVTDSQLFDNSGARVHLETLSHVYLPDAHGKV